MTDTTAINVDQYLPHPVTRVWRALTDPARLARWLMPNDFIPAIGHQFTFRTQPRPGFDGIVHCEVLGLEPEKLLSWSWRGGTLDSTVTWTLSTEGKGTRLFLRHEGFNPDDPLQRQALTIMGGGWRSHIMRALETELTSTRKPSTTPWQPRLRGTRTHPNIGCRHDPSWAGSVRLWRGPVGDGRWLGWWP